MVTILHNVYDDTDYIIKMQNRIKKLINSFDFSKVEINNPRCGCLITTKQIYKKFCKLSKDYFHISEFVYIARHINEINLESLFCVTCGNRVSFCTTKGYFKFCSVSCAQNANSTKLQREKTCLDVYGVKNISQNKEIQKKIKNTNLKKYGSENLFRSKEIQNKIKATCKKKYGTEYANQSEEVKEKIKNTNLNKYGFKNPNQSPEIKEKSKQTNLEKYGYENPFQSEIIKEKIKQTNLQKFGCKNPNQNKKIREKIDSTNLERYGYKSASQSPKIKEKIKQTNLEKYGVEYYTQTNEYKIKTYNTKKKNHSYGKSLLEDDFYKKIIKIYPDTVRQYKDDRYPFACDFYIPSLDLFIELNLFWSHYTEPYNKLRKKHQKNLKYLKKRAKNSAFYRNAIYVWTINDPLKLKTAINNNLKYIMLYALQEIKDWFEFIKNNTEKQNEKYFKFLPFKNKIKYRLGHGKLSFHKYKFRKNFSC